MVLGVLAVLWVLVGPIVALANAVGAKRNVRVLLRRIESLEAQLVGSAPPAREGPWGVPPAEPVASPIPERPSPETRPSFAEAFGPRSHVDETASAETPSEPSPPAAPELPEQPSEAFPAEPPPPAAPTPPGESLESKIGARWTVLVGGLALALGAIFLVRYSIEAGLLGPRASDRRSASCCRRCSSAAGEWLRRRDRALDAARLRQGRHTGDPDRRGRRCALRDDLRRVCALRLHRPRRRLRAPHRRGPRRHFSCR